MVDAQEPAEQASECWYTPGRVLYWLDHWAELRELAMPTTPAIRYDRVNALLPDNYRRPCSWQYTETMVDIERAWCSLHRWSKEFCLVEKLVQGHSLADIAGVWRVSVGVLDEELDYTAHAMARLLGWRG